MDTYNAHSPFTIRLELLKLAQSIENDRVWVERNRLEQDWTAKKDHISSAGKDYQSYPELPVVTYQDVIRVAEELNKFVSNKG
jgi:hypothetical protein